MVRTCSDSAFGNALYGVPMCDCHVEFIASKRRLFYFRRLQLTLPFPEQFGPSVPRVNVARRNLLYRQPSKHAPGHWSRFLDDPNTQAKYEAEWIAKRKAAGLPHVIHNPFIPKKLSASVTSADSTKIAPARAGTRGAIQFLESSGPPTDDGRAGAIPQIQRRRA